MDNKKHFFTTPNPFEKKFGYHRAVKKGVFITVSGTTAVKMEGDGIEDPDEETEGGVHFPKNAKKQAKLAMDRCAEAVDKLGGTKADIVRVRMFVANFEDCSAVGEALRESFGSREDDPDVGAAATMIVIRGFVDPDMLIEVEVDAICSS